MVVTLYICPYCGAAYLREKARDDHERRKHVERTA